MESLDQDFQSDNATQLIVSRTMREDWLSISKWANFLSIVGFVFIGIGMIAALSITQVINAIQSMSPVENPVLNMMSSFGGGLTIFYVLLLGVQLVITYFHFRFGQQLKRAVRLTDQDANELAWQNFRMFCKIYGIVIIVMIVFYIILLGTMGALLTGVTGS